MRSYLIIVIAGCFTLLSACKKEEGTGGAATIKGKIVTSAIIGANPDPVTFPVTKHDIYIIYGDHTYFDDDLETSYDGTFEFRYLQPGNYTVFLYQDDANSPDGKSVMKYPVTISDKKETFDLGTIEIED